MRNKLAPDLCAQPDLGATSHHSYADDPVVRAHVELIEEIGEVVGGWDWWVTLTFRDNVSGDYADRKYRRWIHRLNRKLYGTRYASRATGCQIAWVRGLEFQKRGTLHFHALVASLDNKLRGLGQDGRLAAMSDWESDGEWADTTPVPIGLLRNGFARIVAYAPTRGAAFYTAKLCAARYASKGGQVDFGGQLPLGVLYELQQRRGAVK